MKVLQELGFVIFLFGAIGLGAWEYKRRVEKQVKLEINQQVTERVKKIKQELQQKQKAQDQQIITKIEYVDRIIEQTSSDCILSAELVSVLEEATTDNTITLSPLSTNNSRHE